MSRVWVRAPAKVNLTLEVLGRRTDGYHEIRSVMQSIDLCDQLLIEDADNLSIRVLANSDWNVPPEANLALQAAHLLRRHVGLTRGARITLSKQIPVAAGLGGGSANASATLRALRLLWKIDMSDEELASVGAELGSDVPFCLSGGRALASGRGEVLEALPDIERQYVYILTPRFARGDAKTARMYAAIRPEHYSDGTASSRMAQASDCTPSAAVHNAFEAVLQDVDEVAARTFDRASHIGLGQPHLCGSGPAFFFLMPPGSHSLLHFRKAARALPCDVITTWTLSRAEATGVHDLS